MLHTVDGYISAIFDALHQADMLDESVVIITSDHGGIDKRHGGTSVNETESPYNNLGKRRFIREKNHGHDCRL